MKARALERGGLARGSLLAVDLELRHLAQQLLPLLLRQACLPLLGLGLLATCLRLGLALLGLVARLAQRAHERLALGGQLVHLGAEM